MSRPETFIVRCDVCAKNVEFHFRLQRFADHSVANKELATRGWYYDAETDRCPKHWPGYSAKSVRPATDAEAPVPVDLDEFDG